MKIAADLCVYTNHKTMIEIIENKRTEDSQNESNSSLMWL